MNQSKIISTFLTGGGGFSYEDHIGAFYLSFLLKDGVIYGLENYKIEKISFQQKNQGNPLDDFVIEGSNRIQTAKLSLQAKHNINFGDNPEFVTVIKNCAFLFNKPDFKKTSDKFGIVIGILSKNIDHHYKKTYEIANNSSDYTEFFNLINNQSQTVKTFFKNIKNIIQTVNINTDKDIWEFFKSFEILYIGHSEPSYAQSLTINNINDLVQDPIKSQSIFDSLLTIANAFRLNGSSLTKSSLIEKLIKKGISISSNISSQQSQDYNKIQTFSNSSLNFIKQDINGVIADRSQLINEIIKDFEDSDLIILQGNEGVGKSAILKKMAEHYKDTKNTIVLSDKLLNSFDGAWQGLANHIHLESNIDSLLHHLILTGKDIYIFIDGIDLINKNEKQLIILELIQNLNRIKKSVDFSYKVIVTKRLNSNIQWFENDIKLDDKIFKTIDFKTEENQVFLKKLTIPDIKKLSPLFSNLFFLGILTQIEKEKIPNTEWEIAQLWWNKYITSTDIKQSLIDLGNKLIKYPNVWQKFDSNSSVKDELVQCSILIRNQYEDYYTKHDIYRDWLLAFVFDREYSNFYENFCNLANTLDIININYYLKSFSLFASSLLINKKYTEWNELYFIYSSEDKNIFLKQALFESVFNITTDRKILYDFLDSIKDNKNLIENILDYLCSSQITIENGFFINYRIWEPFVSWLSIKAKDLNSYEKIHEIFWRWRYCLLASGNFNFDKIADIYKFWLTKAYEEISPYKYNKNNILRELIFLSKYKPEFIKEELNKKFKYSKIIDVFLTGTPSNILVEHFPKEYAVFILKNTTTSIEEHNERNQDWTYQASIKEAEYYFLFEENILYDYKNILTYGIAPFSYFLEKHSDLAIDLILNLSDHAMNALFHNNKLNESNKLTLSIDNENYNFYGSYNEYIWFRPNHTLPVILNLAFIDLENWIRNEVKKGKKFKELFKKLLRKDSKNSIALLGIAVSIALENPNETKETLINILSSHQLLIYDIQRWITDTQNIRIPPIRYNIPENIFENYRENQNRNHRTLNLRDFYIPILLKDEKYRNIIIEKTNGWDNFSNKDLTNQEKQIRRYKLQVLKMDASIHNDIEKLKKYEEEFKLLDKTDEDLIQQTNISHYYLTLPIIKQEDVLKITKETILIHFQNIEETYETIKNNSMHLSELLEFLLQLFLCKYTLLKECNKLDFVFKIIDNASILISKLPKEDFIHTPSIICSIAGLLSIKIYYSLPKKYNKKDLTTLYHLILSIKHYNGQYSTTIVFDVLDKLPLKSNKLQFYMCLVNLTTKSFVVPIKYIENDKKFKLLKLKQEKIVKKYRNLKKMSLAKLTIDQKHVLLSEYLPVLLFISKHFKFFSKANRKFSKTYESNLKNILEWNINLSKIREQEYDDYIFNLSLPIFNLIRQSLPKTTNEFINILTDNIKHIPFLFDYFLNNFLNKKYINNKKYIKLLQQIYTKILAGEPIDSSTEKNFIDNILFCSYGIKQLDDNWQYYSEFTNIISKWVDIYGNTFHYYGTFLTFVKHYHSKYPIGLILKWFDTIINQYEKGYYNYKRLFSDNGAYTFVILKLLKENYPSILSNQEQKTIFINIVNKLVVCNVIGAIELQKSII